MVRLGSATPEGLQRAEAEYDRVLLVAGPRGEWTDACLRQADRVVLVAGDPTAVTVPGLGVPCDVVLTGQPPTQAQIVDWHDRCGCRRVYHVGSDPQAWGARLRQLAARLAGDSVALVLAGGGARSLAHLGVLHALEEADVIVDRVAGTSMGALVASLYATGATAAEVDERVFEEFVRRNPFSDYRLSLTSLARGERGKAMLRRCFGDARLEELDRELVVVSTDLYERVPVYHRRGLGRRSGRRFHVPPCALPAATVRGSGAHRRHVDGQLSRGAVLRCAGGARLGRSDRQRLDPSERHSGSLAGGDAHAHHANG